jgi:hypothetical protein
VLAQVPPAARPDRVEVVQRPLVDVRVYLPEVRSALDGAAVWTDDGAVHPSLALDGERPDLAVAWQTAALAVGLPPSVTWDRPSGCTAGGQARIVLAHVLAARASTSSLDAVLAAADEVSETSAEGALFPLVTEGMYDVDTPQGEGAEVRPGDRLGADGVTPMDALTAVGASGWGSDVLAAERLLELDPDRLTSVIAEHWESLVDATTPTERFLALAGVAPPTHAGALTDVTGPHACP